jgi:hypothetical protein
MRKRVFPVAVVLTLVLLILYRVYFRDFRDFKDKYRVLPGVYEADLDHLGENPGADANDEDELLTQQIPSPEIQRLDALVENFERTHDWELALRVGDMYARGCYPKYSPDDSSALKIYMAASRCPDPDISCDALSRFVNLRTNPLSSADRGRGSPFPLETAERLVRCAENRLKTTPLSHYMRMRRRRRRRRSCTAPASTRTFGTLGTPGTFGTPGTPAERAPAAGIQVPEDHLHAPAVYATDTQNVHDHGVSSAVRENIKAVVSELELELELGPDAKSYDRQETIESVMKALRDSGTSEDDLNRAFRVVVSLVPDTISSVGCSQMDVLKATFRKIEKVRDPTVRKNLFESLGKNLASGVERGHVVCSTGKIGRIITTLEGVDQEQLAGPDGSDGSKLQKSVPIDVVRREIATLASKIRADVLSESSERQVSDYNTLPDSKLSGTMDARFRDEVNRVYVDGLHLSEKVLSPIIDTYSSVF